MNLQRFRLDYSYDNHTHNNNNNPRLQGAVSLRRRDRYHGNLGSE